MPTQRRSFPPKNIGRFNYVQYVRPRRFDLPAREPMRQLIQKQFQLLLSAPAKVWDDAKARFDAPVERDLDLGEVDGEEDPTEIFPAIGVRLEEVPNRPLFALTWYVEHDKEWEQDPAAWKVFWQLSPKEQAKIRTLSKKRWHHRSQWNWETLLYTIARDQRFFREVLIEGPTAAGLTETRRVRGDQEWLWQKYALSLGTARRIYRTYNRQLTQLLGEGARPPRGLRAELKRLGYLDARGRFEGRPIEAFLRGKSLRERQRYSDLAIHWFAHALRNLQEWRYGKRPVLWTPHACMETCLKLQQRLAQRPPR